MLIFRPGAEAGPVEHVSSVVHCPADSSRARYSCGGLLPPIQPAIKPMVSPRTAPMATAPRPKLQPGILTPDRAKSREDSTNQEADQRDCGNGPSALSQLRANVKHQTVLQWCQY